MFKLRTTIIKDFRLLLYDKVGLIFMFALPILLVIIITSLQNSTFNLVNEKKISLLICNQDTGFSSKQVIEALEKIGMFDLKKIPDSTTYLQMANQMIVNDALIALTITPGFSSSMEAKTNMITTEALAVFGISDISFGKTIDSTELTLYFHPVLNESYRSSIKAAVFSAVHIVENKKVIRQLYFSINNEDLPSSLENKMVGSNLKFHEIAVSRNGKNYIPNATQHNIPAWTIFAMFFIVTSLGSNIVKEKRSGSALRLRTLPTHYYLSLISKQITYLIVTLIQVLVIFSIGVLLFPLLDLPQLNLPDSILSLVVVSILCGWCAVSYAIFIGTIAKTEEQANGLGAVSIIILAALGGILVPSFAMPDSFQFFLKFSPLYWCLDSYYTLFLENGNLYDIWFNLLHLFGLIALLQLLSIFLSNRN